MSSDFPRVLTLLRKEKGISQKNAAAELQISQALLSHYEKGIRECGLDFLVRCADFYGVSCDYLLGRSPDRQGSTLSVDDIPEPDSAGKENRTPASVLPILNKKLISNSLNILFDLLAIAKNKHLTTEVSSFLMLSVYRMFRIVHVCNPKNQDAMFNIPFHVASSYADSAMQICEANATAIATGRPLIGTKNIENPQSINISTIGLTETYPLFSSSLSNLVQTSESRIGFKEKMKNA